MPVIRIVWLVIVALSIWIGVSFLLSWISGWRVLARVYKARFHYDGHSINRQSAYTRWVGFYGRCLIFTPVGTGIQIEPHFPFWLGHPALEVPWNDIRVENDTALFVELRFKCAQNIPFRISRHLYQKLIESRSHE